MVYIISSHLTAHVLIQVSRLPLSHGFIQDSRVWWTDSRFKNKFVFF